MVGPVERDRRRSLPLTVASDGSGCRAFKGEDVSQGAERVEKARSWEYAGCERRRQGRQAEESDARKLLSRRLATTAAATSPMWQSPRKKKRPRDRCSQVQRGQAEGCWGVEGEALGFPAA